MELLPHAALGFHTMPNTSEHVEGLRTQLGRTRPKGRTERSTRPKGRETRTARPATARPGSNDTTAEPLAE